MVTVSVRDGVRARARVRDRVSVRVRVRGRLHEEGGEVDQLARVIAEDVHAWRGLGSRVRVRL